MKADRRFDIVLYGATGYTGQLVAEYLARSGATSSWALAGRSREKLERVRAQLPGESAPELVLADATDEQALSAMVRQARVVITTVGPYIKYGEPLVKACADAGTDYVDLTGEPAFVELTRTKYHNLAAERQAKIIHACGFDSIPHDLGTYFTLQALRSRLPEGARDSTPITVEAFVRFGGRISGGTWHSALTIMSGTKPPLAAHHGPHTPSPQRSARYVPARIRYRDDLGLWAVPMPTIDPQIVLQSARLIEDYGPDFRYGHYLGLRYLHQVAGLIAGVGSIYLLAQAKLTREALLKLNKPGEGPTPAQRDKSWFAVTFQGQAGAERVTCKVSGGDPGYGDTAKMLAESALCLAFDHAQLPARYGVVTSAAAIGAPLIPRLQAAGIRFEQLSEGPIGKVGRPSSKVRDVDAAQPR